MEKSTVLSKRALSVKISITFHQVPTYRQAIFGLLTESGGEILLVHIVPWRWAGGGIGCPYPAKRITLSPAT
jgi:hypothetical protein